MTRIHRIRRLLFAMVVLVGAGIGAARATASGESPPGAVSTERYPLAERIVGEGGNRPGGSGQASSVAARGASAEAARVVQDTFSHARHAAVACVSCHGTGAQHGQLTFARPTGCAACHHRDESPARCATCHSAREIDPIRRRTLTVSVPGQSPAPRLVDFSHERHASRRCAECHSTPVTRALAPDKAACTGCHVEHHAPERTCASCHRLADPARAHRTPEIAHRRCDACHTPSSIALLTPTRSLCSTCHVATSRDHYEARECTTCHLLSTPAEYRRHLISAPDR